MHKHTRLTCAAWKQNRNLCRPSPPTWRVLVRSNLFRKQFFSPDVYKKVITATHTGAEQDARSERDFSGLVCDRGRAEEINGVEGMNHLLTGWFVLLLRNKFPLLNYKVIARNLRLMAKLLWHPLFDMKKRGEMSNQRWLNYNLKGFIWKFNFWMACLLLVKAAAALLMKYDYFCQTFFRTSDNASWCIVLVAKVVYWYYIRQSLPRK